MKRFAALRAGGRFCANLGRSSLAFIRSPKRLLGVLAIAISLYVGSYAVLSWLGGYGLVRSGDFRPYTWMAMEDVFVWQPRFGMAYPFHSYDGTYIHFADFLGSLYLPLICLDQNYLHPSRPWLTVGPDGKIIEHPWPDLALMHPVAQREIRISDGIEAKYQPELDAAIARGDKKEQLRIRNARWAELKKQFPN
jgi:hypothetical protein